MLRKVAGGGRWRAAFDETSTPPAALQENGELVEALAGALRRRGWAMPALLALESGRPLVLPLAQLLWLAQPVLSLFVPRPQVGRLATFLEDPSAIQTLIDNLEQPR